LMISAKDVDRQCVGANDAISTVTLPAVGFQRGNLAAFVVGLWKSWRIARAEFQQHPPGAVLVMGGFTSFGPALAGKGVGAPVFLHESNSIPGRANRLIAMWVDHVFLGFADAAKRIGNRRLSVTGTPVRARIRTQDASAARMSLTFDTRHPVLLVMGGSQGAKAINELLISSLPLLKSRLPDLQCLHLTGAGDSSNASAAYSAHGITAIVRPFFDDMAVALSAATLAVSRAGASSLAEFAAARLPAILIPYPSAAGNHQWFNAKALADSGAARLIEQHHATPEKLVDAIEGIVRRSEPRDAVRTALGRWDHPDAAQQIVAHMVSVMEQKQEEAGHSVQSKRVSAPTATGTIHREAQRATMA
jgi:UDP-N-acetylglucosamine--N-acetylmuramyl-(pentapeptide) pyrophosphoryl-undecaprenol N-acetylglucosamine transferase